MTSVSAGYSQDVAGIPAIGLGNPTSCATAPPSHFLGVCTPENLCYGGCARDAFERAGLRDSRFTNLRTAATHSLGNEMAAPHVTELDMDTSNPHKSSHSPQHNSKSYKTSPLDLTRRLIEGGDK